MVWRHDYLVAIKAYRNKGMNVVYTDELWANTETAVGKMWKDIALKAPQQDFLACLSTGLKPPNALGPCFCLYSHGTQMPFCPVHTLYFSANRKRQMHTTK